MPTYAYADCLAQSHKVNWRIEDVLGDRRFDTSKRWLPGALSGAGRVTCLSDDERRLLTHVEMAAYAHLFGYVEAFIAPQVVALAAEHDGGDREAFAALTNFAAEEVKHMRLFEEVRALVDATLGIDVALVGGAEETARFVLSKSTGAVLLLTAVIEWFTQRHFLDAWRDDEGLDSLTKTIFRAHWLEEAQHAKMDHLEALRVFAGMTDAERETAVDDLVELVAAVDGLLQAQAGNDVRNLEALLGRTLRPADRQEVFEGVLRAKRWTFIETGVTHPRFQELFLEVTTPAQRERVGAALGAVLSTAPVPAIA